MKGREFNKLLKELSYEPKKKDSTLSPEKISVLPSETKNEVINFLVRKREPILRNFINNTTDMSWLAAMGYMYTKQGKIFEFLCTCENQAQIK